MVQWAYYFYDHSDPNESFLISNPEEAHLTESREFFSQSPPPNARQRYDMTFHWHSWKLFKKALEDVVDMIASHGRNSHPDTQTLQMYALPRGVLLEYISPIKRALPPFRRDVLPNFARCGYNTGKPLPGVMKSRSPRPLPLRTTSL